MYFESLLNPYLGVRVNVKEGIEKEYSNSKFNTNFFMTWVHGGIKIHIQQRTVRELNMFTLVTQAQLSLCQYTTIHFKNILTQ